MALTMCANSSSCWPISWSKLDDEVLELTEDGDLDAEVEQADDEIREKIDLAILTTEDALQMHRASDGDNASD